MNTRLSVAIHILTFLETYKGQPATSEFIASSVNTNPAVIRRLLQQLTKAGMTTSQMGAGGGALLARPAEKISLLDVYRAIDEASTLFPVHADPNLQCPVGRNIQAALRHRYSEAERAMEAQLSLTTIAEMANDVSVLA